MLTKAQIELARDWNAAHYHPEYEHARTCDKALAAYERVVGLLESKGDQWEGHMRSITADELGCALYGDAPDKAGG